MATEALKNFRAYNRKYRKKLESEHKGKVALMHHKRVVGIYDDCDAAFIAGGAKYGKNRFSFQEIGKEPIFVSKLGMGRR